MGRYDKAVVYGLNDDEVVFGLNDDAVVFKLNRIKGSRTVGSRDSCRRAHREVFTACPGSFEPIQPALIASPYLSKYPRDSR
mgnify:CR=1 FL=1